MSQPILGLAPSPPLSACSVYSTLTLAKLSVTFSVSRSSPPEPPVDTEVISTSFSVSTRYSSGVSPALRTTSLASGKCLPLQQASMRSGDDLSMYFEIFTSCTFTLPAPAPLPTWAEPEFDIPQLHERTSMSSLCFESFDSPFTSPSFKNMSTAIGYLLGWSVCDANAGATGVPSG